MEISVFTMGLLVLFPSFAFRLIFVGTPLFRFSQIFKDSDGAGKGEAKQALQTFRQRIPGMNYFFQMHVLYGFFPYLLLTLSLVIFDTSSTTVAEVDRLTLGICLTLLVIWLTSDIINSLQVSRDLNEFVDEVKSSKSKFSNATSFLSFYLKHLPVPGTGFATRKVVRKVVTEAATNIAIEHGEAEADYSTTRAIIGKVGQTVQGMIDAKNKVIDKGEKSLEDVWDENLAKKFKDKYSSRESKPFLVLIQLLWSSLPAAIIVVLILFGV